MKSTPTNVASTLCLTALLLAPGTHGLADSARAATGGVLRVVDGVQFPLTVAGVQAALDAAEAAGGGTVEIPSDANILVTDTSVKIGNGVKLVGTGDHTQTPTFTANARTRVAAMVENKTQNGRQQYAYVTGIHIEGNKGSGARVAHCLGFKHVYLGSAIKDVLVNIGA